MSNKNVCVAVTARPSYSRIRSALEALRDTQGVHLDVLCSSSALLDRYGRVVDLIREDGFNVVEELYTFVEGNEPVNMALTTSNLLQHSASFLNRRKPDCVVSIADRYETLATATAAAYLGLPLVHVQGGELTGNIDEKVRHAITKLSDFHLVSNEKAKERLIRMGENPDTICVTGCPSIDLALKAKDLDDTLLTEALQAGVGEEIDINQDFLALMQHPETDCYQGSFERMQTSLDIIEEIKIPTFVFWPNVDAGSDATSKAIRFFKEKKKDFPVFYVKNLEGKLFLKLLSKSRCLIGNSSVGVRECGFMGVPVVNIGERQFGRDRSENVRDCTWDKRDIRGALEAQLSNGEYSQSHLYGDGYAGKRIAEFIANLPSVGAKRFYE